MRIGIDLGGTKIEIIALHAGNGKELYRLRLPTNRDGGYESVKQQLVEMVQTCEKTLGETGTVGIGMPGCISKDTGLVKNSNMKFMNGTPLKQDLEAALNRDIKIENDANCLAVSEGTDGAGEGADVVFAVIIGTGCGGGWFVHGKPIAGRNGIGGEWGHNPLPYPRVYTPAGFTPSTRFNASPHMQDYPFFHTDPTWDEYPGSDMCFCGHNGDLESWLSGTGFKRDYQTVTGLPHSTHDILAMAHAGDAQAVAALDRYKDRLARALAQVINLMDPDVIVVGGGMSNEKTLFTDVPKLWGKYIVSDVVHTPLKQAIHGDSSGVRGAAWLWGKLAS